MLRRLNAGLIALAALGAASVRAEIWPEQWREHKRTEAAVIQPADASLFSEYSGEAAEKATYKGPAGKFTATAYRLADATGALALFQAERPANATPLRGTALGITTPGQMMLVHQNYVLSFEGWRPTAAELAELWTKLPEQRSGGGLPVLASYLPEKNRIRNSERYVLGPTSLSRFQPDFPPLLAGFEHGAEAQLARFRIPGGEQTLLVFSYPTPQIARERLKQFEGQPGWVVRRESSYIAVAPNATDRAASEALAASVNYHQNFVWNEATKAPPMPNVGGMLVAIFELTGVLLVACLVGGLLFAGLWVMLRRRETRLDGGEGGMISLRLDDR